MNTAKQVNVIMGLLMVGAIATLLYFIWENAERQDSAMARQLQDNAERGGTLFSLNCASCHGLTGKGLLERGGLPGLPLNDEGKRTTDRDTVKENVKRFRETIRCGRVGTLMPAWSQEVGGTLNNFQILQLVALITGVMVPQDGFITPADVPADPNTVSLTGWEHAIDEINHAQDFDPPKYLTQALDKASTKLQLDNTSGLAADQEIRLGGERLDDSYELVKIVKVDGSQLEVQRGADGTDAAAHAVGAEAFLAPTQPGTTINASSCGQTAKSTPQATVGTVEVAGTIKMTQGDNVFELEGKQNPTLAVKAGTSITVNIMNTGKSSHNLNVAGLDGKFGTDDDIISDPAAISGGSTGALTFSFTKAGTYAYRCDFHPLDMKGEITVTE